MTEVAQPTSMTAAEAHAAAAAEGLALVRADNATGFKGVYHQPGQQTFKADVRHGGRNNALGTFVTAEEAALAVARDRGRRASQRRSRAPAPEPAPMTAAEAHAAAAAG